MKELEEIMNSCYKVTFIIDHEGEVGWYSAPNIDWKKILDDIENGWIYNVWLFCEINGERKEFKLNKGGELELL